MDANVDLPREELVEKHQLTPASLIDAGFEVVLARISDIAVVPYRQDQAPRLDFWGSAVRNDTREGDTLWVNYTWSHFSSRSTVS